MLSLSPYDSITKGEKYDTSETYGLTGLPDILYADAHEWAAAFEPLAMSETLNQCLARAANHLAKHSDELSALSDKAEVSLSIHAYPGSLPDALDWSIVSQIRSYGRIGLKLSLNPRLETMRPSNEKRPKNHV